MVIQHNIPAMNSHRTLGVNNRLTSKNLEKLSSGFRINRAGDDAAGLAISEKMRGQIRGLAMAEQNTSNGINLIQTAEGGLNETHAILQRMRELAVQSSNGTYDSAVDRKNLEKEFQEIKSEIDRIADSTHYNGIKLLNGNLGAAKISGTASAATASAATSITNMADLGILGGAEVFFKDETDMEAFATDGGFSITITNNGDGSFNVNLGDAAGSLTGAKSFDQGTIKAGDEFLQLYRAGSKTDYVKIRLTDDVVQKLGQFDEIAIEMDETGKITQTAGTDTFRNISETNSSLNAIGLNSAISLTSADLGAGKYELSFTKQSDGSYLAEMGNISTRIEASELATDGASITVGDFTFTVDNVAAFKAFDKMSVQGIEVFRNNYDATSITDAGAYTIDHKNVTTGAGNGLVFQIGANGGDDQRVKLYVDAMDSKSLGLRRGDIKSDNNASTEFKSLADASIASVSLANEAIDIITGATNMVSTQRAGLGALQNRLEHTMNNLGVTKENLSAAESTIRDVDMAKEMMDFTKNNILVQASQAMLAQANQLPQGVLQLLR